MKPQQHFLREKGADVKSTQIHSPLLPTNVLQVRIRSPVLCYKWSIFHTDWMPQGHSLFTTATCWTPRPLRSHTGTFSHLQSHAHLRGHIFHTTHCKEHRKCLKRTPESPSSPGNLPLSFPSAQVGICRALQSLAEGFRSTESQDMKERDLSGFRKHWQGICQPPCDSCLPLSTLGMSTPLLLLTRIQCRGCQTSSQEYGGHGIFCAVKAERWESEKAAPINLTGPRAT